MEPTLGDKVKSLRLSLGWTKTQLGRMSAISRQQITAIENNDVKKPYDATISTLMQVMQNAAARRAELGDTTIQKSGLEQFNAAMRAKEFLVGSGEKGLYPVIEWLKSLPPQERKYMIGVIKTQE